MKAVIMAGGRGTRIAALAGDLPKPMLPIDGRPVLERELESLQEQGVTDVLISADNLLVSELEVSLGLIDDFRDGRRRIRRFTRRRCSRSGRRNSLGREGNSVNKMLIGSAVGLAMGIGLMMLPGIRQDVQKGANKVKKAVQDMSEGQQ